jgi:hypothetical protein
MNPDFRFFNSSMINSLRSSLDKISLQEQKTSARNLEQYRERMAANRERRAAEAEERRAARREQQAAQEAERNTPEAKAAKEQQQEERRKEAKAAKERQQTELTRTNRERSARGEAPLKAGDIRYDPNNSASINPDGTFNISPEQQAQANQNRRDMEVAREQERQARNPQRREPQPGQVGGPGGYINPNSPEGRVVGQIQRGELPPDVLDTTRNSHRRAIDAVNASPNPNKPGENLRVPERELSGPRTPAPQPPTPAPKPQAPAPQPPTPAPKPQAPAPQPPDLLQRPEAPAPAPKPEAPAPQAPTPAPNPNTGLQINPDPNTSPEAEMWREKARRERERREKEAGIEKPTDFDDLWASGVKPPTVPQLTADFMTSNSTKSRPTVRRMPIIPQSRVV